MSEKQSWDISYFDQHGERHDCGVGVAEPPAFMQATEWKSQKSLRYYADKERIDLEQRYEQLEHVAKEMLKEIMACENNTDGWWHHAEHFRERLRDLGVSLDD